MAEEQIEQPQSVVAVYSGGMDSTVMLYQMQNAGIEIRGALSVDYGQKHRKELDRAQSICAELGIDHRIVDLSTLKPLFGSSSLTNDDNPVPEGHYEEENMKSTVVPNRNMILISIAASWAIAKKADAVAYAAHSGDHAIYPDCRTEFADALDGVISICDWHKVRLYRPFVSYSKSDIARLGHDLGTPLEKTWSCYKGGDLHCGKCGTCVERREAFYLAGIPDLTPYAGDAPSPEDLAKSDWKLS